MKKSKAASSKDTPELEEPQSDEMDKVLKELEDAPVDDVSGLGEPQVDEMDRVLAELMDGHEE